MGFCHFMTKRKDLYVNDNEDFCKANFLTPSVKRARAFFPKAAKS